MKKLILILLFIALICLLTACDFVSEGIIESKFTTGADYRIVVMGADGNTCVYATDSLELWESVSVGDSFHFSLLNGWKPSAENIYI